MSDSLQPHGLFSPWNSPGQNTGVGSWSLLQGIFSTQGSNPGLLHCRQILYQLSYNESPRIPEWVAYPFSSGSSWLRNWTGVSCIAGNSLPTELWGKPPLNHLTTQNGNGSTSQHLSRLSWVRGVQGRGKKPTAHGNDHVRRAGTWLWGLVWLFFPLRTVSGWSRSLKSSHSDSDTACLSPFWSDWPKTMQVSRNWKQEELECGLPSH